MKIEYTPHRFSPARLELIERANEIIDAYAAQGYDLTIRQLFYQFVSRDLLPNQQREYKRLGEIVSKARRAGLVDWDAITDRTRALRGLSHWEGPSDIMEGAARSFRVDKWATQPYRVEVWIEKDALAGVFERVCNELDVPFFACRGYASDSEMWAAAQRYVAYHGAGQTPVVLHFGDHDPSGVDMTRDIKDKLRLFTGAAWFEVDRLALNMPQVERYDPPPNPAKQTDSRYRGYVKRFGAACWELDALEPNVLAELVRGAIEGLVDDRAWAERSDHERRGRALLEAAAGRWEEVEAFLRRRGR